MKLERSEFDVLFPNKGGSQKNAGGSSKGAKLWPPPDNENDKDNSKDGEGGSEEQEGEEQESGDKGSGKEVTIKNIGKGGIGGTMTPEISKRLQEEMGVEIIVPGESDAKKLIEVADNNRELLPKEGGTGKGLLRRAIAELSRPKVDWKGALKRFIGKAMSNSESILPNRRFVSRDQYISGEKTRYDALSSAIVAVDTSGSMSKDDITGILSEVLGIIKAKKVRKTRIIYFDDGIQSNDEVKFPNPKIDFNKVEGGGGTTFYEPLAYMLQEFKKNKAELLVFCTDGMNSDREKVNSLSVPPNFRKILVWIVMDMPEYEPPFGAMVVHISKKDLEN